MESVRVLNRIITWEEDSISVEADLRHVKTALEDLGLKDAKGVGTPAMREL